MSGCTSVKVIVVGVEVEVAIEVACCVPEGLGGPEVLVAVTPAVPVRVAVELGSPAVSVTVGRMLVAVLVGNCIVGVGVPCEPVTVSHTAVIGPQLG